MKRIIVPSSLLLLVCLVFLPVSLLFEKAEAMPVAFTQNMGQWDSQVLYRATAGGATMWFCRDRVVYQFTRHTNAGQNRLGLDSLGLDPRLRGNGNKGDSIEQLVITAKFVDANPNAEIQGEGLLEYKCNYFLGNDPSRWHTDVPNYSAVTFNNIYPGIAIQFQGVQDGGVDYEFTASPEANLSQVQIDYEGADGVVVDHAGRMVLKTAWGDMTTSIKSPTQGSLLGSALFSLVSEGANILESDYPMSSGLGTSNVSLVYSTFLGGGEWDIGQSIAVDKRGSSYVTGMAISADFPTEKPYQSTKLGLRDVFVTKFSPSGTALVYSTYLGGSSSEIGYSIAVDSGGSAYITGVTASDDFPTQNPCQPTYKGGNEAFVTKLNLSGDELIYSTYLGGNGGDGGSGVAANDHGCAFVIGSTESSNFPTRNPYQSAFHGGFDAFITMLTSSGALAFSTYLGGTSYEYGNGIAVDSNGSVFVIGETWSTDFPTKNAFQPTRRGQNNVFVTKFSPEGTTLVYSTYLGGSTNDWGNGIALDSGGNVYVTGVTLSTDFPTQNAYQAAIKGGDDAFLTKLNATGSGLVYSTYLGGADTDYGLGIAVNSRGEACVVGWTLSSDFPTEKPYQLAYHGASDVFVTKFNSNGNALVYSTYLGGGGQDYGYGIAVDLAGYVYATGETSSSRFPLQNPFQSTNHGPAFIDAFVTKLSKTPFLCGDADGSGAIDVADPVFLIHWIFVNGPSPQDSSGGDYNCDGKSNIADAVYLINYIFTGGPAPCSAC